MAGKSAGQTLPPTPSDQTPARAARAPTPRLKAINCRKNPKGRTRGATRPARDAIICDPSAFPTPPSHITTRNFRSRTKQNAATRHCSRQNTVSRPQNRTWPRRNTDCPRQNTHCSRRNMDCPSKNMDCPRQNTDWARDFTDAPSRIWKWWLRNGKEVRSPRPGSAALSFERIGRLHLIGIRAKQARLRHGRQRRTEIADLRGVGQWSRRTTPKPGLNAQNIQGLKDGVSRSWICEGKPKKTRIAAGIDVEIDSCSSQE